MPASKSESLILPLWFVWLVALVFVGVGLGSYAILDNNEGLYAEIPREMLHSGDWHQWVIPHLNGLAYMEKPPLLYWLTAISFAIFGESEWAARLVPALSGLSCVASILWFSRKVDRVAAGRLAAVIFISGLGVTAMSRTLMFDMLLTALLSWSFVFAYFFVVKREHCALRFSLAFLALALLAKGFVAVVLYCAVMGAFVLSQSASVKDFGRRLWAFFDWRAIGVFLLIAAPWHIVASLTEPIFAWFYFINEHVLRFLGKREPHDYYAGAWWYYLPRMVIYLFPWSFALLGLWLGKRVRKADSALQWFLGLAWLMPVLFFSISSAKANYYLVTVMPFAALQLSIAVEDRAFGGRWGRIIPGLMLSTLFLALSLFAGKEQPVLADLKVFGWNGQEFVESVLWFAFFAAMAASFVAWRSSKVGILAYLLVPVTSLFLLLNLLHAAPELGSAQPIAQKIQTDFADRTVYLFKAFEEKSSLAFYLKKPVHVVESRSADLFWGNRLHHNDIVLSDTQFAHTLARQQLAILVLDRDKASFESKEYYSNFNKSISFHQATLYLN